MQINYNWLILSLPRKQKQKQQIQKINAQEDGKKMIRNVQHTILSRNTGTQLMFHDTSIKFFFIFKSKFKKKKKQFKT